jgi:hypothetical protein
MKKRLRKGFGADCAFTNVTFGNLLFAVQWNVWFDTRYEDELYGVGTNYTPEFSVGYSIQF